MNEAAATPAAPSASPAAGLSRRGATFALLAVLALHGAAASTWMYEHGFLNRPPPPEGGEQQEEAAAYARTMRDVGVGRAAWDAWTARSHHTKLVPLAAGALGAARGDFDVGPRTQWLFALLCGAAATCGAYRLARRFLGRGAAVLAAALFLLAPALHAYQRVFYWQYPMTALLPWGLRALAASDGFRRFRPAVACGLWFGLATSAKVVAPLYVVGSSLVALGAGLRRGRRAAAGALVALAAFALVVGPWCVRSAGELSAYTRTAARTNDLFRPDLADRLSLERWLYYPRHFVEDGVGPPAALAALVGVFLALRRRGAPRGPALGLALDAVIVYAATTYGQAAGASQYMQFLAFPTALLVAAGVDDPARGARATARFLAAGAAAYMLWVGFRPLAADDAVAEWGGLKFGATIDHWGGRHAREGKALFRPEAEAWPIAPFAEALLADAARPAPASAATSRAAASRPPASVRYVDLHPYVNRATLAAVLRDRLALELANIYTLAPGDYFTLDPSVHPPEFVSAVLERLGLRYAEIARAELLPGRVLSLCRIDVARR